VIVGAVLVTTVGIAEELRGHGAVRPSYRATDVDAALASVANRGLSPLTLKGTKQMSQYLKALGGSHHVLQ
jgi:hypothetical protein